MNIQDDIRALIGKYGNSEDPRTAQIIGVLMTIDVSIDDGSLDRVVTLIRFHVQSRMLELYEETERSETQ